MRKADVYRLNRAVEKLQAAIANLEDVHDRTESWQHRRTGEHLETLRYELSTMKNFAKLMSEEPEYQKQD